ncbi:Putative uncharacterized protein [Lactobacillus acidophilus DSM 9126]|nr:Putative uncharacterized protein [Lactobacillus acidophilus DSM 20079 = JCM 1132 = NBRC 13951 = CIP 76.13]CDF69552.1 Putative uncharacterized protein [Lactobacillus acidophilus CIRM-BIA 442]CDF71348.1 Putative uncharacterized protein [Lactobacillus acidophilus CIRM-BIA 445]CDF73178.1 Putative uncharacterized protein [Lactobacillus acidophilus DSM 9126]CDF75167.1 Putative uncharacterized protein [Lactobacillus acidophilus DSM 20242]
MFNKQFTNMNTCCCGTRQLRPAIWCTLIS